MHGADRHWLGAHRVLDCRLTRNLWYIQLGAAEKLKGILLRGVINDNVGRTFGLRDRGASQLAAVIHPFQFQVFRRSI
jgi:hypothetical protein